MGNQKANEGFAEWYLNSKMFKKDLRSMLTEQEIITLNYAKSKTIAVEDECNDSALYHFAYNASFERD